jgi:hypothetical protein
VNEGASSKIELLELQEEMESPPPRAHRRKARMARISAMEVRPGFGVPLD